MHLGFIDDISQFDSWFMQFWLFCVKCWKWSLRISSIAWIILIIPIVPKTFKTNIETLLATHWFPYNSLEPLKELRSKWSQTTKFVVVISTWSATRNAMNIWEKYITSSGVDFDRPDLLRVVSICSLTVLFFNGSSCLVLFRQLIGIALINVGDQDNPQDYMHKLLWMY